MSGAVDNPDRALIERIIANGAKDVALDINQALRDLSARLVTGEPGRLELSFVIPDNARQGNGVVAGGVLMTILDYAMALAVLSKISPGKTCATTSIGVNMQVAATRTKIRAIVSVDRVGRQIAFARGELIDAEVDVLLANASATFFVMDFVVKE